MPDLFDEVWKEEKQVAAQERVKPPDMFDEVWAEDKQTGNFRERMAGAMTRGLMSASRGIRYLPKHIAKTVKEAAKSSPYGPSYNIAVDPSKVPAAPVVASVKEWYNNALNREDALVQRMFDRHPEWETTPPENFLDLVSSPDKLAIAVTEALPLLLVAGLATAAGQPAVAATLIFSAEAQSGYDTAIADGQSEEMAEKAYWMYGSVATALELMQLKGLVKIGKKAHAAVLKKAVGKLGKFGKVKDITKAVLKTAIEEALEEQAQGTWGEATSYILYDKKMEGGWKGFIDRRLQEGLIAGTMAGGSAVGGASMAVFGGKKNTEGKVKERFSGIEKAILTDKNLSPDEKKVMLKELKQVENDIYTGKHNVKPDEFVAKATPDKQLDADEAKESTTEEAVVATQTAAEAEYTALTDLYTETDDTDAGQRIQNIEAEKVLEEDLPSYDSLFAKVMETGDEVAVNAILNGEYKDGRSRIPALQAEGRVDPTIPPTETRAKKFASVRIHDIADMMGMETKDRRKIQVDLVGKKSVKDMTIKEAKKVEAYFVAEAKKRGLVTSIGIELAEFVKGETDQRTQEKKSGTSPAAWKRILRSPGVVVDMFWAGSVRVERMFSALDGFTEGPIYNSLWRPVIGAIVQSRMSHNQRVAKFREALADIMAPELDTEEGLQAAQETISAEDKKAGKKARKLTKRAIKKLVGGSLWAKYITGGKELIAEATATDKEYRLSPSEKIGAFLAMKNPDSMNHLLTGNLAQFSNPEAMLLKIIDAITPQERAIAQYILDDLETNFDRANQAAVIGLGRQLEQQDNYFPIKVIDTADMKKDDFLGQLENKYTKDEFKDKPGETKKRSKGAAGSMNLDSFGVYLNHLARIEQFIHMAPVAKSVGNIVNTQEFRQSVNRVTAGHGAPVMSRWLKNSIKGHASEATSLYAKTLLIARQKGVIFALAGNLPSVARQFISGFNYSAMHPMLLVNATKLMGVAADPRKYRQMEQFMKDNSDMMVTRNFEREVARVKHEAQTSRVLQGKQEFSNKALAWQRWADNRTTTIVWNSAYQSALTSEAVQKQFKLDGSEKAAKYFADKMVMRTQPMGDVEHLPDFFTGGPIESLLSTFQNQVNNNLNFWAHDIVGEYRAGNIDKKMVAYRALFSYILPSQMFGAISRGGLPDDWKDALFDVAVYGLGPIFLIGRIVNDALLGYAGGQTSVEDILPSNFAKGLQAGIKAVTSEGEDRTDAAKKSVLYNLKTVGGVTGLGPNALFKTGMGIYDIYTGETDDLRRLIYSDWSLTKYGWGGKDKEEKTKRMTF
jgi:hypothetical protein